MLEFVEFWIFGVFDEFLGIFVVLVLEIVLLEGISLLEYLFWGI